MSCVRLGSTRPSALPAGVQPARPRRGATGWLSVPMSRTSCGDAQHRSLSASVPCRAHAGQEVSRGPLPVRASASGVGAGRLGASRASCDAACSRNLDLSGLIGVQWCLVSRLSRFAPMPCREVQAIWRGDLSMWACLARRGERRFSRSSRLCRIDLSRIDAVTALKCSTPR